MWLPDGCSEAPVSGLDLCSSGITWELTLGGMWNEIQLSSAQLSLLLDRLKMPEGIWSLGGSREHRSELQSPCQASYLKLEQVMSSLGTHKQVDVFRIIWIVSHRVFPESRALAQRAFTPPSHPNDYFPDVLKQCIKWRLPLRGLEGGIYGETGEEAEMLLSMGIPR